MKVCSSCCEPIQEDDVMCFRCGTPPFKNPTDEELLQALKEDEIRTKFSVTQAEIFGYERHTGKDEQ